ncbi:MAG: hypothetical protein IJ766_04865 [Clostridia bacterium]|nr:hypothetical protein [Clostridia bacterium]
MKVIAEHDCFISVELTAEDMDELNITYDALDYSNTETRRVLWTVLDEARRLSGEEFDITDRLVIETMPADGGGCLIIFTAVSDYPRGQGGFCCFFDLDAFLDFMVYCRKNAGLAEVCLYTYNGDYYAAAAQENAVALLTEFCDVTPDPDGLLAAAAAERMQFLQSVKI